MTMLNSTNDKDFTNNVLNATKPVLVDFGLNGAPHANNLLLLLKN